MIISKIKEACANKSQTDNRSLLDILQQGNVQRIYVHDYSDIEVPTLNKKMSWVGDYRAERAIVMAQRDDLVVVNQSVDKDFLDYLDRLNLGPGTDRVLVIDTMEESSVSLFSAVLHDKQHMKWLSERVNPNKILRLNTFYCGQGSLQMRNALAGRFDRNVTLDGGTPAAAVEANRKDSLRNKALDLAVPIAKGEVVDVTDLDVDNATAAVSQAISRCWAGVDEDRKKDGGNGGVIIRAAWSGGGLDNLLIRSRDCTQQLMSWLTERPHIESYLVELLLEFTTSPNVQLWVHDDGTCSVLETTDQRLDKRLTHVGNSYPYRSTVQTRLNKSALDLCEWLAVRGYRGPIGMDFLVTSHPSQMVDQHYFVEVNGRINGATYMIALFERVNQVRQELGKGVVRAWISSKNLATNCDNFSQLSHSMDNLLYTHQKKQGAIPYNTGMLNLGFASFIVLAESVPEAESIELELMERINFG